MADSFTICPKCGYKRLLTDTAPEWQCPSCGVAYVKALQAKAPAKIAETSPPKRLDTAAAPAEATDADLEERQWLASRGQKIVIYSILINFVLRAADQSQALPVIAIQALYFATATYSLLGVLKICSGLGKSQNRKILFMVLSFFPLINLVSLVYLNVKATRLLRDAGWTVGLFGARP
jgi:hypothetical protein